MYVGTLKTNSMFHTYDTWSKSDLFQVVTPNYLNKVSHTMACLFITNVLMKWKVLTCIVKLKKMII